MKSKLTFSILGFIFSVGSAMAQPQVEINPAIGGGSTVGMDNPGAKFCREKHGVVVTAILPDRSQMAMCSFGKAQIDSMSLLSYSIPTNHKKPSLALSKFINAPKFQEPGKQSGAGMANPASVYCKQVGGESTIVTTKTSSAQYGLCVFKEKSNSPVNENDPLGSLPLISAVEEFTLFHEQDAKSKVLNNELRKVIKGL